MNHKELLKLLSENGIRFVVIGGVALRLYNSPRLTHDIDIVGRILDLDKIVTLMYRNSYYLIRDVKEHTVDVALTKDEAESWVEKSKSGSISFILLHSVPEGNTVGMEAVDASTQVDFLFEPCIPVTKLLENARKIELQDLSFYVASVEDLITLKKHRSDKNQTDEDDIRYLENLINRTGDF